MSEKTRLLLKTLEYEEEHLDSLEEMLATSIIKLPPSPQALIEIITMFKRIQGILKQATKGNICPSPLVSKSLLVDFADKKLMEELEIAEWWIEKSQTLHDYLWSITGLPRIMNLFFDQVLVICDSNALRANRLALLQRVYNLQHGWMDFALLHEK